MWMLLYHRASWMDVAAAGWNLDQMRELQAEMVEWAHEEPLDHTKLDVDAICHALQDVRNEYAKQLSIQTAETPKQQTRAAARPKKRDHPPRVYRQIPLADQGIFSANAVLLPGLKGVAFAQVTDKPKVPGAPLTTTLEADGADSDDEMMDADVYEGICPHFHTGKGCTLVEDGDNSCDKEHPYNLKFNCPCPYQFQGINCPFGKVGCKYVHENIILPAEQQQTNNNAVPQVLGRRVVAPLQVQVQGMLNRNEVTQTDVQFYLQTRTEMH